MQQYAELLRCDGFELMIGKSWYPQMDEMIETVKSYGLNIPVIHANKALGEYLCGMTRTYDNGHFNEYFMTDTEEQELFKKGTELFRLNLRAAQELGARKMVLHLWNGVPSDRMLENNIKRFGTWKKMADEAGVDLMVENVICNVNDPLSNILQVADAYGDAHFVYDTKMAEFHGQTLKLFEEPYVRLLKEGRIRHLHINDYGGGYKDWSHMEVLPIGSGHVDFDTFFRKLYEYGYDGDYTVETTVLDDNGNVDVSVLNGCFDKIREYVKNK
ncbi:MAG: sugar phosphate isomerase/epimerase [Acetatifactor sp.]|nr:sugar phosphate isomerase/epimerase [Acetatifactor sp.]